MRNYQYEEFTLAEFKKNLQIGTHHHTVTVKLVRALVDEKVVYMLADSEAAETKTIDDEGTAKAEFMNLTFKYIGLCQPK